MILNDTKVLVQLVLRVGDEDKAGRIGTNRRIAR